MSTTTKTLFIILFVLVFVSLGLNIFLVWQLQQARAQVRAASREMGPVVQESIQQTIADLETFEKSAIEFNVQVDQEFPVEAEIPFNETIEVPIQLVVPIQDNIETTIEVDLLNTGNGIPIDVTVPIDMEVPIDTTIPVEIDRTIPISTSVPLNFDVPVVIEIGNTELAGYLERIRGTMTALDVMVEQLLSEVE